MQPEPDAGKAPEDAGHEAAAPPPDAGSGGSPDAGDGGA
jgi:hypothetical protein